MALPTPYGNANKDIIPLLKGVPPPRTYATIEFIQYAIIVDGRFVYVGPSLPIVGFPETKVFVYASHRDRVKCYFTFESWRRSVVDIVWQSVFLPTYPVTPGRWKVVIPGIKPRTTSRQVVPAAVRIARRRVSAARKDRIPRSQKFPRSSTVRPSPETRSTVDSEVTEGNNGGYFLINTPSSYVSHSRSWSGVRTPGFGKLKKSQLPVNAHSVTIVDTLDSSGARLNFIPSTGIYFNLFRRFTSDYAAPPSASHLGDAQFKALRKLIDKANSGIDANLAQDLAQYGQTVTLIRNTATRLAKSYTALKKGDIPGAVDQLWRGHHPRYHGKGPHWTKSAASNWLELQYGWKPLIQDVKGAMDALKRLNSTSSPLVVRVTASAQVENLTESKIPWRLNAGLTAGKHILHTKSRAKYSLRYKIDDKLKAFLAQTGFTNPINLVWEILPLSFVVDWFLPIGPYLETLSSWDGLSFLDGSLVLFTRETANSAIDFTGSQNNQNYEEHMRYRRQTVLLNRSKLTALPSARIPSVKNGLSSATHAANAIALLRAAFR